MRTKEKPRIVEMEITLDAPPEEVWQALTDPEVLTRWFPLEAKVEPGPGGSIFLGWGPEIQGASGILVWEPGKRLKVARFEQGALAVDYTLNARAGQTVLRLVHSGFGASDWNDEYDGVRRGWQFELRSLSHYLRHKRGLPRRVAWARAPIDMPYPEAWDRLWSSEGLLKRGAMPGTNEHDRYSITFGKGDTLEGAVLYSEQPTDFSGTVENLNNSLFRVGLEACAGRPEAQLWLFSWDMSESEVQEYQVRWTDLLRELLD